jgi:hypothetical protein
LLRCVIPLLALTDESASVERTAAIRPAADINPLCQARLPRLKMTHLGPERPILLRCEAPFPLNLCAKVWSSA